MAHTDRTDMPAPVNPQSTLDEPISPGDHPTGPPQPDPALQPPFNQPVDTANLNPTTPQKVKGYEILGELGRGGMGVVYKARQVGLNRLVALKMILSGSHTTPVMLARFQAEAVAIAKLQHPNIVQIYETGQQEDLPYLSLEYVEGGSLDQRLASRSMPVRESAHLTETLARAVHAAHQAGIIHRDLKPANVLLTANGVLKITDFGLAKTLGEDSGLTASGAILGTPSYMAPEQADGRKREITRAVDIYSLGAILYELLTGQPPFRANTPLHTLHLLASEDVKPPRDRNPSVPRELEAICLKCLQKDPSTRYPDAASLANDLQRFLDGVSVSAYAPPLEQQAQLWLRKHWVVGPIILLTACVALFSALALTYLAPTALLYSGWVVWVAAIIASYLSMPNRRGMAVAGVCTLLFAHLGWSSTVAARPLNATIPFHLSIVWIEATTVLFFLLPSCALSLAAAGFCSLVLGLAFIGVGGPLGTPYIILVPPFLEEANAWLPAVFLHPITVAAWCIVLRSIAWATGGNYFAAVIFGFWTGMLSHRAFDTWLNEAFFHSLLIGDLYFWLYPAPPQGQLRNMYLGEYLKLVRRVLTILSLLPGTCTAFFTALHTNARIRQIRNRTIRSLATRLLAFRRSWIGVVAVTVTVTVAVCVVLLLSKGTWQWATSRELLSLKNPEKHFKAVALSPDGERLAALASPRNSPRTDQTVITIWDVNTGKIVRSSQDNWDTCLVFTPDGKRLAATNSGRVIILDAAADREIVNVKDLAPREILKLEDLVRRDDSAWSLGFSADGKRLAVGSRQGIVHICDATTGHVLLMLPKQDAGGVISVTFSPGDTQLVTCTSVGSVKVWDSTTGKEIKTLHQGSDPFPIRGWPHEGTLSPDGRRATAGARDGDNTVRVWEVETGKEMLSLVGHTGHAFNVAFSSDGKWLASVGHDRTVRVWDASTGQGLLLLRGHTDGLYKVAFSLDSRRLASIGIDGTIKIWRIAD